MTLDARTAESFGSDDAVPASQPTEPLLHQHGEEVQQFGTVRLFGIALSSDARIESSQLLNQVLAPTR
jgi:starvation-inducible DNA-binding protein